jgi:hypothetical protein
MNTCYICHRNDDEVRTFLIELVQNELNQEEQFVKIEMEDENKKVLDLQAEWEILKTKASNDISNIMGNDIFYLLKNVAVNQNVDLKEYFDRAGAVLGNSINSIKIKDIENELRDKIDKIKNLNEYNTRLENTRTKYQISIDEIKENKNLIQKTKIKLSKNDIDDMIDEVHIDICSVCRGLIKSFEL